MKKNIFAFSDGPSTSVVHVQPNFHIVAPGVWRSAKLNPESLKRMKTYGLKTIVNLRLDAEKEPWEDGLAKQLGIQCFHFPISGAQVVPVKTVEAVLSILSDPARQPVLVYCAAGKDRTGMIMAAYRIAHKEWPFRDIYQEMMMYGYDTHLPEMLETLRLWSAAQGLPKIAQEIALTGQKISGQKKQTSIPK
jgi:protein tyrosine/serine phosphatase